MYRKKNIVIITMCVAVLLMIVGYAAFSANLKINGAASITSNWNIYFESITTKQITGSASNAVEPTVSALSARFEYNFKLPGDKIVYEIVLKNGGTLDAIVSEINAEQGGTGQILYEVEGIQKGDKVLKGESRIITITIEFDREATFIPEIKDGYLTIDLTCVQANDNVTSEDLVVYQPTLKIGTSGGDTTAFLGGPILKNTIESITFTNTKTVPSNAKSWDVSANSDGKVMAWYLDADSDGLYEVVIGQDGGVIANPNSSYLFYYLINVETIDLTYFDTSLVTNMYSMFGHCHKLTSLDVSHFDTGKVTTMNRLFRACLLLTELDLSSFDTSKVTDMRYMFNECSKIEKIDLSSFNTSKVNDMSFMFGDCRNLTKLDISNFATSKVTNMTQMFYNCRSLTKLDISNFDTSKVTIFSEMFYYCSSLTYLDLSHFDTSSTTDMYGMFQYANLKDGLDVSNFNTSKVTNMMAMFMDTKMSSLDLSSFDTSKVTNMASMFSGCVNLTSLDLSSFDTAIVTRMDYMFSNCQKLATLNFSKATFDSVTLYTNMFNGTYSTMTIKVKSETERIWILDKKSTANVIIV